MKLFENKAICLLLMVVLIAAGTWLGGYKGLSGLYGDVEDVFFVGEDRDGICIANDLSERVAAAQNLVTIANNYPGVSAEAQSVSAASAGLSSVISARDITGMQRMNQELDTAMTSLYHALGTESLGEQHEKYRQKLYADFNSRGDTISHDPYNSYAQSYNDTLAGFPASLFAAITPVKDAVIFY